MEINGIKAWLTSDYECDRVINSDRIANQYTVGSATYKKYAVSDEKLKEAKDQAGRVGLYDTISQLFKAALELILWPVFGVGAIGYGIYDFSIKIYQGEFDELGELALKAPLIAVFYSPASAINRVRLIALDLLGAMNLIEPETVAIDRQLVFSSFVCHGQSLLMFLYNTARGDPYNIEEA